MAVCKSCFLHQGQTAHQLQSRMWDSRDVSSDVVQVALHLVLPGKRQQGVPLPDGSRLTYKLNGRDTAHL